MFVCLSVHWPAAHKHKFGQNNAGKLPALWWVILTRWLGACDECLEQCQMSCAEVWAVWRGPGARQLSVTFTASGAPGHWSRPCYTEHHKLNTARNKLKRNIWDVLSLQVFVRREEKSCWCMFALVVSLSGRIVYRVWCQAWSRGSEATPCHLESVSSLGIVFTHRTASSARIVPVCSKNIFTMTTKIFPMPRWHGDKVLSHVTVL